MKRLLHTVLQLLCCVAPVLLPSCRKAADDGPVTMLVTHGFGESFYRSLASDVKQDLGIDLEFRYEISANQSALVTRDFIEGDLKADIIFNSVRVDDGILEKCCLDLMSSSSLASIYTYERLADFITDEGAVYQMPLSSKLIGITYNATLMEEKGWALPRTFDDMLELKRKCDAEGILFAVTDIYNSGQPFNYLFNIMGAQWLSTVKGTVWFEGFLAGTKTAATFKARAAYFKKWAESGLFGELYRAGNFYALREFAKRRALFCYSTLNTLPGYKGPKYDAQGRETGEMLDDVFKSMPWISENGANNCFTVYDNCWVMVNGALASDDMAPRRQKVLKVLEYMMSEKYRHMMAHLSRDAYLTFSDFEIISDRMYSEFADEIRNGFIQPWYYNNFDERTVIATGAELGSYLINTCVPESGRMELGSSLNYEYNPSADFDSAIGMLWNSLHLWNDYQGRADEIIGPANLAMISAIAGGLAMQERFDNVGLEGEITVGLMPYAASPSELQPWKNIAVQNVCIYPGVLRTDDTYLLTPAGCLDVEMLKMTGAQIEEIVAGGFDPSGHFTDEDTGVCSFDAEHYGPYPYACAVKGGAPLEPEREYLVAVSRMALDTGLYRSLASGEPVTASLPRGFSLYFGGRSSVNNGNIYW